MNYDRVFPPSKHIKDALKELGWTQADLAIVLNKTPNETNYWINQKRMTPEWAQQLGVIFGQGPEYWMNLDNEFRLSQTEYVDKDIALRSYLFRFPIKEMQKRGWIADIDLADTQGLQNELQRFLADDGPEHTSFKRTIKEFSLNTAEKAWLARARHLARVCPAAEFNSDRIENLQRDLRRLAAKTQAVRHAPEVLQKYGIRFVIIEPLPRVKIDGASFWLNDQSPVIALSIRFDNIGSFWFALLHEVMHIKHKDRFSFDDLETSPSGDEAEVRANDGAAEVLIPSDRLQTFINMYSPMYSETRINSLATQLQIHPGIIVGQLQFRKEIGYNTHRKVMTKVRDVAIASALTDGWGQPIPRVRG